MKKLLLLLCVLLTCVSRTWADVLPSAVVGTYAFQATTLTTGASGHTITKDGSGNVTISPNNSGAFGATSGRFICTLVVKINVPSTTTAGVLCEMRQASGNTTFSQGLYMIADRKLKTSWQAGGRQTDANAHQMDAGEHTIIFTTGEGGSTVYVDGTSKLTDTGLKASGVSYKAIYIPAAYESYITEVYFYSSIQSADNITSIATECSNHMQASQQSGESVTVPSGKTLVIDTDANLSKFSDASSIAIAAGKTLTLNEDGASISLSGRGTALQSSDITTTVTGNLSEITLQATNGSLKYTGVNLSGSTLDGVVLASDGRINLSNTVTIKNVAGNDLTASSYDYVFVSASATNLILEGTCDFTRKSNGDAATFNHIAIGNASGSITVKSGANVSCGKIWYSDNLTNAPITVESGATLTSSDAINASTITNNGTITATGRLYANTITNNGTITALKLQGATTLGEGSTTTLSDATPFAGGAVTVSGDATLNLTATTAALSQAITIAADKTLTIDGASNTVNLNVVPTFNSGSKINFTNATINYENSIRNLANYTFTSSTAQFTETGTEYAAGGFTITNIPTGVTVKVKKYGTSGYETVTPADGTATFSHSVEVSGSAAWLDYTFNESTKATNLHSPADQIITNAGNAGSGNNLTIDTNYNTDNSYNDDGTLKVMSTPWRNITWPTNYTVAVAGNVPDVENGCLVAFGSSTNGTANYLAIIRGASQNEIKLVKGHGMNNAFEVISTMTAANATALSHLVVFTKNGNTFTVYLDGIQKTQVTYSDALGGGFQIGSIHGGVTGTGVGRVNDMATDIKNKIFAKTIRVYDYVISAAQMSQLTAEFPYVSFGGTYSRTISENSNLSATDAWLKKGSPDNVDVPVNAIVDAVTYYPDVEITTTAASTLTVNADMDAENIKFDGAGKLTIASDGEHNISIFGSLTANGPVSFKYGEIDLTAVPVTIGESGSVEFDFSDYDFSGVTTSTDYPVTGLTSNYGAKVTSVYPDDEDHTYSLAFNSTTNSYYLTVGPSVTWKQKQAIALVTPYYNGSKVGTAIGKYTISLGETSYANLKDFGDAVMAWEELGDCVEPTITLNTPAAGYYRFKNVETGKYLVATATSTYESTNKYVFANGNNTEVATVIHLVDNDGHLYMYNQGYAFGWTATSGAGAGVGYLTTIPDKYVNWFPGTAAGQIAFAICYGNGTGEYADYLKKGIYTANEDEEVVAGTDETADEAQWIVEEVTEITIPLNSVDGISYATFSAPFPVTIGDGAQACKITTLDYENGKAQYAEIANNQVPAGAGVLIMSESNASSVTATISNSDFSALEGNLLRGFYFSQSFEYDEENDGTWNLVLGNDGEEGIGFYKMSGTATGNKAYLPYSYTVSGGVKGFRLVHEGGNATGISAKPAVKGQHNASIYNLAGQRMSKLQKGFNIVNGKKMIVK